MFSSVPSYFEARPKMAHLAAALVLLILVTGMFWRVVFLGETMVDAATLQNQLPWGGSGPTYLGHSYNRRDITDTYITREYFLVDSYKRGEWPMWSPYNLGGHPMYADGVFRMFSPFNVLYWVFDVPRAYDLTCLLQLFLTGLFTYLFFINIRLGPFPALFGAMTFMFASLTVFHVTSSGWLGGLMWLPLIFLSLDRAIERGSHWAAVGAGVCLAMQFYCGYMPNQIYYLGAIVTYYGFQALFNPKFKASGSVNQWLARVPVAKLLVISLVVGMALSAAQWMPIFELLGYSNRKIVPTELEPNWLPPWYLITALLPHVFGEAYDPKFAVLFVGIGVSHAHTVYFGLSGVLLGGFGGYVWWVRRKVSAVLTEDRLRLGYFLFLLVFSTFVMCAVPLYVHITQYIPVLQTIRVTNRVSVLFTFSTAAVVAYGLHFLLQLEGDVLDGFTRWIKRLGLFYLSMMGLVITLVSTVAQTGWYQGMMFNYNSLRRMIRAPLAISENFDLTNVDYFPGTLIPLVFFGLVFALFLTWRRGRLSQPVFCAMLLAVAVVDLGWNASQLNESYPRSLVYHPSAATTFLQSDPDVFRVVVAPANFSTKGQVSQFRKIVAPPNTLVPYRIQTISGKDQLFPRWYREMASAVQSQNYLSHVVFDPLQSSWYDLWNVKYLMTNDDTPFVPEHYVERFAGEGVRIYENPKAKPRAFFVPRAIGMPDTPLARKKDTTPDEVVKLIKSPGFDPLQTAYVQGDGAQGEILYRPAPDDFVKMVRYQNNTIQIAAKSASGGVLVLSDTYYPGWNVYVDGVKQPLWRADHALRAVKLTAGEHQVEFRFEPVRLKLGLVLSGIALVALTLWGSASLLLNRRSQ
ncbi:MAG TPA: YfhO family protein [Acidobacteriota bacterium]|nr:YfhO family protein [Acidobacteriota bacterium]